MTISPRQILFATLAASSIAGASAAQSANDQNEMVTGQDVAQASFAAEIACRPTLSDITVDTAPCLEALEDSLQALARYQQQVSEDPEKYGYTSIEYGNDRNPTSMRPSETARTERGDRMGHDALITETHRDVADTLDLNLDEGLEQAIIQADIALKKIFIYSNADSFGVHPEGNNIGNIIVGLSNGLRNARAADPSFDVHAPD